MDTEQFSRIRPGDLDNLTDEELLSVKEFAENIVMSNSNYDAVRSWADVALNVADLAVEITPQGRIGKAAKYAIESALDTASAELAVRPEDPLSTEYAKGMIKEVVWHLEYRASNPGLSGPDEASPYEFDGDWSNDASQPGLRLGAVRNAPPDVLSHPQKDIDLSPLSRPASVYQDPIMRAAKNYPVSTSYQDPIMRAAQTYHPPATPLAHPVSQTPPPRPATLSYGIPLTQAAINALPYNMGTVVQPTLSYGLPPVSAATLGALGYSLGTQVAVPVVSTVPYVSPYAPTVSPNPPARPAHLGGGLGGLLNGIGNAIGRALGSVFDPIAKALDSVFHPNGYKNPNGSLKDPADGPTSKYSRNGPADKNGDGKVDSKEKAEREADFDRQREEQRQNRDHNDNNSGVRPILLDLDGNGVKIDDLSRSTKFIDAGGDGLKHRTAWAGSGDGVLFFDADGDGTLSQKREYVFTEWDPTANSDMEALRAYFAAIGKGHAGGRLTHVRIVA